jgi:peptidoglycan hydrolase-like protein with peptidoglycan-binding domain
MADEPELRESDRGDWVTHLQQLLNAHGASLEEDGWFGPLTEDALKQFQTQNGLAADGVAAATTWAALQGGSTEEGGGGDADTVPPEVVALGLPAKFSEWTDEQKEAYFGGEDEVAVTSVDTPEAVEVLAINDEGDDDDGGEVLA